METLEEQNEELDLDELQGKEHISVPDILKVIQEMKADLLSKTVTEQDLTFLKQQSREAEKEREQLWHRARKDHELINKIEDLQQISGKFRDLQLTVL